MGTLFNPMLSYRKKKNHLLKLQALLLLKKLTKRAVKNNKIDDFCFFWEIFTNEAHPFIL